VTSSDLVVRMPKLADTLVEGTVGQWLKHVGEPIARGEPLATIETDKVTTELASPSDGTLAELLVLEGQPVPVETPIARIATAPAPASEIRQVPVAPASAVRPPKPTPVAARLLAEHGLSVDQLPATSERRLRREDVLAFISSRPSVAPLSGMRRAIADHMTRASQSIPHGQSVVEVDLTHVVAWREAHKHDYATNLTFTALFVHALARRLASHLEHSVDIGVAVALRHGLIVPVLRRADELTLEQTASGIADLADRARSNQLQPADVQGAHMTLTNVGSFGNLLASPIIPLGQLGILGPGRVERRPLPTADGGIRPCWRCLLTLMFDRRELDDFAADRFLRGVADELRALALSS
jgi:pyruvate/2-oxoglutarate dehydrogenase complex dihydrolipoamide acyltransferase (E2) component